MKILASLLVLSCILFLSCNRSKQDISVMTFNIRLDTPADGENRWEARIPVVAAYMDTVSPDIVGMQEVLHNQLIDLQNMMPGYSYVGTGRDDGKQGGEYSPVFFKKDRFILRDNSQFWLSKTPDIPGSKSWDAAITRIVSWAELEDRKTGETLYVFNTHFDHRGVEARLKSIELMAEEINKITGNSPVIVTGDFNIRKSSDDYNFMVNTFAENNELSNAETISKTPVVDADATFNAFRKDIDPRVIDFIFVDNAFKVNSYRVDRVMEGNIFISDHWPVVSEITMKNR